MKLHRVVAIIMRHLYEMRHNWVRVTDMIIWPVIDLMMWGFTSLYLQESTTALPWFLSFALGGIILWVLFFRCMQDVSVSFINEIWDRNMLNLFVSPLQLKEFFAATFFLGILKLLITTLVMMLVTEVFYHYNFFTLGWGVFLLLFNLVFTGWTLGILAVCIILRFGSKAEVMAWWLPFFLQPFSAVTFPLAVLPDWMQSIGFFIPTAHVFEALRTLITTNQVDGSHIVLATILNIVYFALSILVLSFVMKIVRDKGLIARLS